MANFNLVSKQWCDLVFKHKNKAYGAYQLRAEAGKRYTCALWGVCIVCFTLLLGGIAWSSMMENLWEQELKAAMEQLHSSEILKNEAFVFHYAPPQPITKPSVQPRQTVPDIVDEVQTPPPSAQPEQTLNTPTAELSPADTAISTPFIEEEIPIHEEETLAPPFIADNIVNEMPTFPGGYHQLMRWLDKNIIYPPLLAKEGIEGTTYLTFFVDTAGIVSEPFVEEPLHPMITSAILKAVERMPKWECAAQTMTYPKVKITIPIEYYK
ncbi:MAG: energy transducer TonB [Bacteroidaceae bacterium]|nr:energy transducer TonB [Bacteroidaceae bacterium]